VTATVTAPPFQASHPLLFLDYFRVPYVLSPARPDGHGGAVDRYCGRLWRASGGDRDAHAAPTLAWLRADAAGGLPRGVVDGRYQVEGVGPLFCHVVPDAVAGRWLSAAGDGWRPLQPVADVAGAPVASVWRRADGSVFLPFDPGEAIRRFWSEGYRTGDARALVSAYYAIRPALPRPVQIALRRVFTRVQRRAAFPGWPVETALHDLYEWLFRQLTAFAGRPVPWLDLWPDGRSWALVLTHDVETADGCRDLNLLRDVERQLGFRSSWNFVPLRYQVDDHLLRALTDEGCEIGVHGVLHDGRDLGSRRMLDKRLPTMREYAARWNAVGFRAPATQRVWEWMPLLGFDYDSSYHDTAPYEPTPGGCCSYLPYFNEGMVELPITLPQDHTIYTILQHGDETVWLSKAAHVRSRRGMALVLSHPDYAGDARLVRGYRRLLEAFEGDETAWRALPREVSAWWRRRAESTVEETGSGWRVRGPASADGGVRFARAGASALAADIT
jgi:hypothetical protein